METLLSGQLGDKALAPVGTHCILELYGCSSGLLDDPSFVQRSLRDAAEVCESTLLGEVIHEFHPQGVTALALLAESHISIHTWPELRYAAIDIFTCGASTKPEEGCQYLIEVFESTSHTLNTLSRHPLNPLQRSPKV
ncbi:MAG: adenosylmethionine decarboxylase [Prochlorotrichaceae cyanobacterium]